MKTYADAKSASEFYELHATELSYGELCETIDALGESIFDLTNEQRADAFYSGFDAPTGGKWLDDLSAQLSGYKRERERRRSEEAQKVEKGEIPF